MSKSVLELHRAVDGSLRVRGEAPDEHSFSSRYVKQAEQDGLLIRDGMDIVFDTVDGPLKYKFVGFGQLDNGDDNLGAWQYRRVN